MEPEMKNPDEDYAYETYRQKQLDAGFYRPQKFEHADPWKGVPFAEESPPADGLLLLWSICIALIALITGYLIWGPK
jgi:hypothetical protein